MPSFRPVTPEKREKSMITYLYWAFVLAMAGILFWSLGYKARQWRGATIAAGIALVIGWSAHFFYFENLFVKRFGGVMSIATPEGQQHIATTWKDDNLWVKFSFFHKCFVLSLHVETFRRGCCKTNRCIS